MIGLPHKYRFVAHNGTGQTIAIGGIKVTARRAKFDSQGALVYEASEATILENSGTVADGAFEAGATQENSTDRWLGGDFVLEVTAPASANGDVTLYLERATNGSFDDNGLGTVVVPLSFTEAGTKRRSFSL